MAKRGPKPKKTDSESTEKVDKQPEIVENVAETVEKEPIEEQDHGFDPVNLPKKDWLRIDEVAKHFDVKERTIRNWIEQDKIEAKKIGGTIRIPRESVLSCGIWINSKRKLI